jgi:tetratricopeptide (TPR) repeat protein
LAVAIIAGAAVAAWPAFIAQRAGNEAAAGVPTPAPVVRDYAFRDEQVAFWERAARLHSHNDFISPRYLSGQYMQRYRERGDIGDVVRALAMAQREERVVPHSVQADVTMVPPLLTLHRFSDALEYVRDAQRTAPTQADLITRKASLEMELGRYEAANADLRSAQRLTAGDDRTDDETIRSRYDELTGHLARAREALQQAATFYDAYSITATAQSRAWYHYRLGELSFLAGDNDAAIADEQAALQIFPNFNLAYTALARFELATHHPREALEAATDGAEIAPLPETLGYKADAQRALGDLGGAAETDDLIAAIERIGNAYRVNDRLIAVYYSEHRLHRDDALRIARRDAANRGDEIYAQDTLAWAAAMAGHWDEARRAIAKASRYDTEDPRLQFHAGMIALHFGDREQAKRRISRALALNPNFHPVYAEEARLTLARL